jgi:hypothetical protein
MTKLIFRANALKIYRGLWFVMGFLGMTMPFSVYVQHKKLGSDGWLIIAFLIAFGISIIIGYFTDYLSIQSNVFALNKLLRPVKIDISLIDSLSYERRLPYHYLIIKYRNKEKAKELVINTESMSTDALQQLNEEIRRQNPSVEISIDANSQKYQQLNFESRLKTPKGTLQWAGFSLKWLVIGAVCMFVILWFAAPR